MKVVGVDLHRVDIFDKPTVISYIFLFRRLRLFRDGSQATRIGAVRWVIPHEPVQVHVASGEPLKVHCNPRPMVGLYQRSRAAFSAAVASKNSPWKPDDHE